MMYCFLKTKSCEDRRNKGLTGYNHRVWGPAAPTMPMGTNILTCNNPGNQARSTSGQTVLSCIANMSRAKSVGRSRKTKEPINMSSPKMVRKRKMQEEKLKKELLKIDEKIAKKSTKKKLNGRRSGHINKQNYRIIVN